MLEKLRKFSNSFFAKIFLFIIAIPFVFWGMGDLFTSGSQKTIVKIENKKISTEEFINFVNLRYSSMETINDEILEKLLSTFIGQKLIEQEVEKYNIVLSDKSLAKILKNTNIFMKDNKFSRTEYEKFLIKNNLSSNVFEENISMQEEKNHLLNFIGGGILPSNFLVNYDYNKTNQERLIEFVDLNAILKNKLNFSEDQIQKFYDNNKETYKIIFKSIKFLELNPKILTGKNDFNDLFFKKIDEIDDLLVEGESVENISKHFNIENIKQLTLNESGQNKNFKKIDSFPSELVSNIFNIKESEPVILVEHSDKYFLIELLTTEELIRDLSDNDIKNLVISNLKSKVKRNYITDIINKINNNKFSKKDFDIISRENNVKSVKVKLKNISDDNVLKKDLVNQIYLYPQNRVIVATDIGLNENYLVYIEKINNALIDKNNKEYQKYSNLSKAGLKNDLYGTYETYLRKKYKIDINYSALDNVKNYF